MARTVAEIDAEIEKLKAERSDVRKDEMRGIRERCLEDLKALHAADCLADKFVEAATDTKGVVNFGRLITLRHL